MEHINKILGYFFLSLSLSNLYSMDEPNLDICKTVKQINPDNTYELHCYDKYNRKIQVFHFGENGKVTACESSETPKQQKSRLQKIKKKKSYIQLK